jgi:hypothetical protein
MQRGASAFAEARPTAEALAEDGQPRVRGPAAFAPLALRQASPQLACLARERRQERAALQRAFGRTTGHGFETTFEEESMAFKFQRNAGMLLLGLWLVLTGLAGLGPLALPFPVMGILALVAGILILAGR